MGLILLSLILRYWINTVEGKQEENQGQRVYTVQTKSNSVQRAAH